MKRQQGLRQAGLAVIFLLGLVLFVASTTYSKARDTLADEFATEQYWVALYVARHVGNQFDLAAMGLRLLAAEAGAEPGEALADRCWERLRQLLNTTASGVTLLPATGAPLTRPDAAASPPAETLARALAAAATGRPRPVFYRTADGSSRLVLVQPLGPALNCALTLDVTRLLTPPTVAEREMVVIDLLESETLEVVGSTAPLIGSRNFGREFETDSARLFEAIRAGRSGREHSARGLGPRAGEPYLIGVQGLSLGGLQLTMASTAPRRALVDGYLKAIMAPVLLLGLVALVGLFSFLAMILQSRAAETQEQARSEERASLLKISYALLSEKRLTEVLGRIADESRALFKAEGATIALVDEATDELVFRTVSSDRPEVIDQLLGLRIPRDEGVLGWVVAHGEGVIVHDAGRDARFSQTVDAQTGGQTMALLCAPLLNQNGETFGAIELVNNQENPFPESDLVLLKSLAVMASAAVERAVFMEREEQQTRLRREMDIARTVQQGLLPRSFPILYGFDLCGASDPAREVGGDFFDFIPISERQIGVVIADVADKGLGAAMFMVMCRSLLYACANRELSPSKVLRDLNEQILEVSTSDLFVTIFYGVLDTHERSFTFTNAGHNPPLLYEASRGAARPVTVPGMALGVLPEIELAEGQVFLEPGDRLVLYTDGITEAINRAQQQFGLTRVANVLRKTGDLTAEQTVVALLQEVTSFAGGQPQFDDMTLAVIHATAVEMSREEWLQDVRTRG